MVRRFELRLCEELVCLAVIAYRERVERLPPFKANSQQFFRTPHTSRLLSTRSIQNCYALIESRNTDLTKVIEVILVEGFVVGSEVHFPRLWRVERPLPVLFAVDAPHGRRNESSSRV